MKKKRTVVVRKSKTDQLEIASLRRQVLMLTGERDGWQNLAKDVIGEEADNMSPNEARDRVTRIALYESKLRAELLNQAIFNEQRWTSAMHEHTKERGLRQGLEHLTGVREAKNVAVSVLMLGNPKRSDGGSVYLAKRATDAKVFPNMFETGGGKVDPGETVDQTAIREMKEETGLEFTADRFTHWGVVRCKHETDLDVAVYLMMVELREDEWPSRTEPTKRDDWYSYDVTGRDPTHMQVSNVTTTTPATLAALAIYRTNKRGVK